MAPKLYTFDASSPCRAVYLTAAALGIELELTEVNLMKGEHVSPQFIKINPQHTVPTLIDDDGTCIWDSHAIITYLTEKYGKDDSLYPKDLSQRAVVNQRLHFDSGLAFPLARTIGEPIIFSGVKTIPVELQARSVQIYDLLEKFLDGNAWLAGKNLTLADLSLIVSVTTLNHLVPIDTRKFPKLQAWIERVEKLPYYDLNEKGLRIYKDIIDSRLNA